jgi:hypothetical protein
MQIGEAAIPLASAPTNTGCAGQSRGEPSASQLAAFLRLMGNKFGGKQLAEKGTPERAYYDRQ